MEICPIKTESDYQATLKEIDGLMLAEQGSPEGDRLDVPKACSSIMVPVAKIMLLKGVYRLRR